MLLLSWCLMSSDVIWHIRDKLWPMPKHGSIRMVYACLAVTCHLHFWQNDRDFLRATVVTRGWNGYRNKSQHRKSTLEKKILPPFQQGFEPATFQSRVRRSNHWAIPAPCPDDVPLVEFIYLAQMPGVSYCRQLRSLLLCFCDIFWVLINSLVCWQGWWLKAYGLFQMHGKHLDLNWTFPKVMGVEFAPNILWEGQGIWTTNNNGLFYVLFSEHTAHYKAKNQNAVQKKKKKKGHTNTIHTQSIA